MWRTQRQRQCHITVVSTSEFTLSVLAYKIKSIKYADLTWTGGGTSPNVDIYRNGTKLLTTPNDGADTDKVATGTKTATYQVCEADSTTACSNSVTVGW